ncbi:zf-HC2 domain-containing protein, partial [Marinobacter sp. UBA2498]
MSDKPSITPSSESHQWSDLHHQIQDWLAGYADGELDEHHITLVEAHLAGCE